MEKMKRKKFLKRLSCILIVFSIITCVFLVFFSIPPEPYWTVPPWSALYLSYVDKNDAIAVYIFETSKPLSHQIGECRAWNYTEYGTVYGISIPYTLIHISDNTTISTGDILLIHNITNYPGWRLVVVLDEHLKVDLIKPETIPYISNQTAENTRNSEDVLRSNIYGIEEIKLFVRVEDYGKE